MKMSFIIRSEGWAMTLVRLAPRWLFPAAYNVRVEQDCSTWTRVHILKDNEPRF